MFEERAGKGGGDEVEGGDRAAHATKSVASMVSGGVDLAGKVVTRR